VYPGAKKESITATGEHRFEVKVKEPAERNLANSKVINLLAQVYGVGEKKIRIISGHHSSRKIFSIEE
jgi:uncharacterized protein (TIGR00251 family)